ncbi:ATP-dependent zinc protease family protein [Rhodohalobacter sp. 8-1]|uniref:ATP-dependent zinc protease family protein n=1 Tax=Rhodohalobacter sp. 8-1 TaxID=3131972 RepID=UPI0030EF59C6
MKKVIGRIEKIGFPNWAIDQLDAKVDTGAYTSSLHCHKINVVSKSDGEYVQFSLFDPEHPSYQERVFESKLVKIRKVKSSNGTVQKRYTIKETARFCGKNRSIELTLTDRSAMKYDLLLGRKFLEYFLVDVSKKYLTS